MDEPERTAKTARDHSFEDMPDEGAVDPHTRLSVLLVADVAATADAALRELARSGATIRHKLVQTMPEVEAALAEPQRWDVVIVDQAAKEVSPASVLGHISALGQDVPLFVIAEAINPASAVDPMSQGAKDYILTRSLFRLLPSVVREFTAVELRSRQSEVTRLNEALNEIHTLIHSTLDADEMLQRALDKTCEVLPADNGAIQVREHDRWVIRYQNGLDEDHRGESFSDEQMSVLPQVLETMEPVIVDDLQAAERHDHDVFDTGAVQSTVAIPLALRGELFGLVFLSRSSPSRFTAEATDFAKKLGAAISLAMQNVDMIVREREYASLSDTLSRINEILLEPFDPVSTMRRVVAQARELLAADGARIIERVDGEWVFAHVVSERAAVSHASGAPSEDALLMLRPALERAESVFVEDTRQAGDISAHAYRASIALPLVVRGEVVAVLSLEFVEPRAFTARERTFAERLRSAVSLALENEERLREESSIATLADALEHAEADIYSAPDEPGVVSLALKTASMALGATGACAVWCDAGEITTVPPVPRVVSVDLDSNASLVALMRTACEFCRTTRDHATVNAIPTSSRRSELIALALPSSSDPVVLILERQGGQFRFKKEELSFAERLGDVAGLAMENLRLARERASLASTREEWLAGISHDLRTPLAAVRGYAELLAATREQNVSDVRDQSQRILEQTDRIERMIVDMLLAFRIRANALPVASEPVHLRPLLEDVRRTVLADRRARGRRMEVGAIADVAVLADPTLLERAVTNLAMNAVVHNPLGVLVSLWASERDGRGIVQVTDDGCGMDETTMNKLFVRYHKASASGEGAAGAGLGIPIARQVVEAMGGTLEIESAEGAGTTATISLPLAPR